MGVIWTEDQKQQEAKQNRDFYSGSSEQVFKNIDEDGNWIGKKKVQTYDDFQALVKIQCLLNDYWKTKQILWDAALSVLQERGMKDEMFQKLCRAMARVEEGFAREILEGR